MHTQSELITAIVDLLLERSRHFEAAYAADYQVCCCVALSLGGGWQQRCSRAPPGPPTHIRNTSSCTLLLLLCCADTNHPTPPQPQHNMADIFPVLQKLSTGVDVNVKFSSIHAFEVRAVGLS
jgi:hypothetical protein